MNDDHSYSGSMGARRPMGPKPVEEGHVYDLTIESIGAKGDGIGKINGFVVIVPKGQQGSTVKVKINAVRAKFAFGEIVTDSEAAAPAETETEDNASEDEDSDDDSGDENAEETEDE